MSKCCRPNLDTVAVILRPITKAWALAWVNLTIITIMNVHFFTP